MPATGDPVVCEFRNVGDGLQRVSAGENGRPRLLQRLRSDGDAVQVEKPAMVRDAVLRPELLNDFQPFQQTSLSFALVDAERVELGITIALPNTEKKFA